MTQEPGNLLLFFSGILSVDYLSEVELRLTNKANITIGAIEGTVEVLVDSIPDKPFSLYLRLKASRPLACHVKVVLQF